MDDHYVPTAHPKRCCVKNCANRDSKRHRFPKNNREVCNIWIELLKPPNYETLSVEEINKIYVVCEEHFDPKCIIPSRSGLKLNAVPTLNVPGFADFNLEGVAGKGARLIDGGYIKADPSSVQQIMLPNILRQDTMSSKTSILEGLETAAVVPSSSGTNITSIKMSTLQSPESPPLMPSTSSSYTEIASTQDLSSLVEPELGPSTTTTSAINMPSTPKMSTFRRSGRRFILRDLHTSRSTDLTPRAKKLYHTLTNWGTKINYMQKRLKSYKERLIVAENFVESTDFVDLLKYINHPTYKFVMCQVRNQLLKPKGRRYTLDEKILALSIHKASGKAYRFLSKMFSLPTPATLRTLLAKIPLQPGINSQIFKSLKDHVQKMKSDQEKICALMFDELSIDANVTYDKKKDSIMGLEDYGTEKKGLLADHANVFFLKGIYKQWRQPLSFTFSNGPAKSIKLKEMIKQVIIECQRIGLEVVATVCDQGCTNQSAVNMLLQETKEQFLRTNTENPYFGFLVNGQEVIPLFDVPHLFKGIRNNLLTKNLHFVMDGEEKVAKWVHIEQFYNLDSSEPSLRLCSKLTDQHVIPTKINKMKVKLCTQVFSHAVGALMKRISSWNIQDNHNMGREVGDTADLILFLDKLFDSLNVIHQKI